MINILCFGDSNTYGYIPDGTGRYDENTRWTGLLQKKLGTQYHIIEEGLCGRTTVFQDEFRPGRRGVESIGILIESHNPIDVLIIMLGTNDCKTRYGACAGTIAKGIEQVMERAQERINDTTKIVLVSPILLKKGVGEKGYDVEFDEKSEATSKALGKEYKQIAEKHNTNFLDASLVAEASNVDREHLDAEGHKKLARAVYEKVLDF